MQIRSCVGLPVRPLHSNSLLEQLKRLPTQRPERSRKAKMPLQLIAETMQNSLGKQRYIIEYKSWVDNEVFDLVDWRTLSPKVKLNYVTGRWVLTLKREIGRAHV